MATGEVSSGRTSLAQCPPRPPRALTDISPFWPGLSQHGRPGKVSTGVRVSVRIWWEACVWGRRSVDLLPR